MKNRTTILSRSLALILTFCMFQSHAMYAGVACAKNISSPEFNAQKNHNRKSSSEERSKQKKKEKKGTRTSFVAKIKATLAALKQKLVAFKEACKEKLTDVKEETTELIKENPIGSAIIFALIVAGLYKATATPTYVHDPITVHATDAQGTQRTYTFSQPHVAHQGHKHTCGYHAKLNADILVNHLNGQAPITALHQSKNFERLQDAVHNERVREFNEQQQATFIDANGQRVPRYTFERTHHGVKRTDNSIEILEGPLLPNQRSMNPGRVTLNRNVDYVAGSFLDIHNGEDLEPFEVRDRLAQEEDIIVSTIHLNEYMPEYLILQDGALAQNGITQGTLQRLRDNGAHKIFIHTGADSPNGVGHWISVVIHRQGNNVHYYVMDSCNWSNIHSPYIRRLISTIEGENCPLISELSQQGISLWDRLFGS